MMYEGWIPISQELPKENARVLFYCEKEVSYDEYTGDILDWWVQEGSYSKKYGFFVYDSPDIGRGIDKKYVIAWAPLPQPYRGLSEERTKA